MARLKAIYAWLDRSTGKMSSSILWVVGVGLVTMALITTVNSLARWLFAGVILWSFELAVYLFVGVVLLSLAHAMRTEAHIRIPVVFDRLPRKAKPWLQFASDIILLIFTIIMLIGSVKYVTDSFQMHSFGLVTAWPLWIPQLVMPIGFTLLSLEALVKVLKGPQRGKIPEKADLARALEGGFLPTAGEGPEL